MLEGSTSMKVEKRNWKVCFHKKWFFGASSIILVWLEMNSASNGSAGLLFCFSGGHFAKFTGYTGKGSICI